MSSKPLVTVIIPVYNGARFLLETLQSVYRQTYSMLEIITINHGSTDESATILASQPDIKVITQEHRGNAYARNTGIINAQGNYLAFIDQDDLWEPQKIEIHLQEMLSNPQVLYTISHFQSFLSEGSELPSWAREETFTESKPDFSPSSLVANRDAFALNGLFNEDLRIASDVDWFFQAKDRNLPMIIIPQTLHKRRVHGENQSNLAKPYKSEMLHVIKNSIKRKNLMNTQNSSNF